MPRAGEATAPPCCNPNEMRVRREVGAISTPTAIQGKRVIINGVVASIAVPVADRPAAAAVGGAAARTDAPAADKVGGVLVDTVVAPVVAPVGQNPSAAAVGGAAVNTNVAALDDGGGVASSASSSGVRAIVPLPTVRKLRLHMDSCPSTNKSQFFYGGLGLLIATELIDCAMVHYMVVGHTKFGPDLVARQIAGRYNKSDCFNNGQLVELMRPYATAGSYDGNQLQTWKEGTKDLFSVVTHIMSYRCFLLVADDGKLNLGTPAVPPASFEPFPDSGPLCHHDVLMHQCDQAAYRGLKHKVLPELRTRCYQGVGQCAVPQRCRAEAPSMLLPAQVGRCRNVRLFTRRSTSDVYWREQVGWMKSHTVDHVSAALDAIKPYSEDPRLRKDAYGAKAKSIREQYFKYVPREFVPDRYEVPEDGQTDTAMRLWKQSSLKLAMGASQAASSPSPSAADTQASRNLSTDQSGSTPAVGAPAKKARWSRSVHAKLLERVLQAPPFNGTLPKKKEDWEELVKMMPVSEVGSEWDVPTLRRHAKALTKEGTVTAVASGQ